MFQGMNNRNAMLAALALTTGGSVLLAGLPHAAAATKTITTDQAGSVDGTQELGGSTTGNELIIGGDGAAGAYNNAGDVKDNKVVVHSVLTGTSTTPNVIAGGIADNAGNVIHNTLDFRGGKVFGTVSAGMTDNGRAENNEVTMSGGEVTKELQGGDVHGAGSAIGNKATLSGGTVGYKVTGGHADGAGNAEKNEVNISGGQTNLVFGGWSTNGAATGNKVNISGGTITGTVKGAHTDGAGNAEHNEVTVTGGTMQDEVKGALSKNGNASYNKVTISGGSVQAAIGGYTWMSGNAANNEVTITGGEIHEESYEHNSILGADAKDDAKDNKVTITNVAGGVISGKIYGGRAVNEASGNRMTLGAITVNNNVWGGYGAMTNNNIVSLAGTHVTGSLVGGSAAGGTGNTLEIRGAGTEVAGFDGIQRLHFYLPKDLTTTSAPMLKVTGPDIYNLNTLDIGAGLASDISPLKKDDKVTLMQVAGSLTSASESIENKTADMHSISMDYQFALHREGTDKLTATVTKAGIGKRTKSFVETRAASSSLINGGGDLLTDAGMAAAGTAAARAGGGFDSFAVQGGSSLRLHSGSYVDSKGWSLSVGFAREKKLVKGAVLTFGPLVEYGRGSYDSYLDDGTHADGKTYYIGAGVMAKLAQKSGSYIEGSLRAGKSHSDYSGNIAGSHVSYDSSSAYYAAHIGLGHEYRLPSGDVIDGYAKYFYAHQNGATVTLSSGARYAFDAVNSHRIRIGGRYTHKDSLFSEVYAGLAYEYEFDSEARATYAGYSTPSPTMKGGTGLIEVGYRFAPKGSRISYGASVMGMKGKREGISGGVQITWAF